MAAKSFEHLVNRVLTDEKFRKALQADPKKTLKAAGIKSTPALLNSLKEMDWASVHRVNTHYKAAVGIST